MMPQKEREESIPSIKLAVRPLEQSDTAAVQRLYERAVSRAMWLPAVVKADAGFTRSGVIENLDQDDPEIIFFRPGGVA